MATSPNTKVSFTSSEQESLTHLSDLLHLIHHRNKNQHRRAVWYRHFQHFRKQLSAFVEEIAELNSVPSTHLEKKRKRSSDDVLRTRMAKRLTMWRDVWVAKWWAVFSQVVAEGRFAVVGLVLVAVLGEVGRVVGVTEGLEVMGEEEVRGGIERFGREMREEGGGGGVLGERGVKGKGDGKGEGEDMGVTVARDEGQGGDGETDEFRGIGSGAKSAAMSSSTEKTGKRPASPMKHGTEPPPKERKKKTKKRKSGNAIDDLFSALG